METAHSMVVMFMLSFSRTAHTLQDELTSVVNLLLSIGAVIGLISCLATAAAAASQTYDRLIFAG